MTSVADLITQVRTLADMTNSNFVTDTEILAMLNQGYSGAYTAIVKKDEGYFAQSVSASFVAGVYSLPSDCFKVIGVDLIHGDRTYTLKRFNFADRNKFNNTSIPFRSGMFKYNIQGSTVTLTPNPTATYTGTLWYIPYNSALTAGGTVDFPVAQFDDYIIYSSVAQCLAKEQSSNSYWVKAADSAMKDILENIPNRDVGEPDAVIDTYSQNSSDYIW